MQTINAERYLGLIGTESPATVESTCARLEQQHHIRLANTISVIEQTPGEADDSIELTAYLRGGLDNEQWRHFVTYLVLNDSVIHGFGTVRPINHLHD